MVLRQHSHFSVFEFPETKCRPLLLLSDSLLPAPRYLEKTFRKEAFSALPEQVFGEGTGGLLWAGAPLYIKIITDSYKSRFIFACTRKVSQRAAIHSDKKSRGTQMFNGRRYYDCDSHVSYRLLYTWR